MLASLSAASRSRWTCFIAAVKLAALWRRPPASDRARANLVNGMTAYALFLAKDLPSLDVAKERAAHCMAVSYTHLTLPTKRIV